MPSRHGRQPSERPAQKATGRANRPDRKRRGAAEGPCRIVAMGGGTGLSTVLGGLKRFSAAEGSGGGPRSRRVELSAIVTVSDDGGSSGRLRREFDILAPGDIRNCMVALAEDEALLSKLFQHRFSSGKGLEGHSFGNLFLTALTAVSGDFQQAIQLSSEVLAIRGRIFPSTLTNVELEARLEGGRWVRGESRITKSREPIKAIRLKPRRCLPLPESLSAIAQADLITIGPGSLYTSVIPNLLVEGIPEAIAYSPAVKVYVCNLMGQPGETEHYSAADHVRAIYDHARGLAFDYVVVSANRIPAALRRRYVKENALPVEVDIPELEKLGVKVLREKLIVKGQVIRHDADLVADLLLRLARPNRKPKRR